MALKRERCFTDPEFRILALIEEDIDERLRVEWKGGIFEYELPTDSTEPGKVFDRRLSKKEKAELIRRYKDAGWENTSLILNDTVLQIH